MSNVKIGDTFTIEINRIFKDGTGRTLYGVKGFNVLVFDDVGIGKLKPSKEKYTEEAVKEMTEAAFQDGENVTWELINTINSNLTDAELNDIFHGLTFKDVFRQYTPQQAGKMIAEFMSNKKKKEFEKPHVGDILLIRGHDKKCIVTDIEEGQYCHLLREDGRCFWAIIDEMEGEYEKTGNNEGIVKAFLKNINHITIEI